MSNNPEVKTPFSEHDLDLVYRFHIGEIDIPELQSRLEFWRPARQLTQNPCAPLASGTSKQAGRTLAGRLQAPTCCHLLALYLPWPIAQLPERVGQGGGV